MTLLSATPQLDTPGGPVTSGGTLSQIYGPMTASLLRDFLSYADDAAVIVAMGKDTFDTNPMLRHAADGLVAKIGEAVSHLPAVFTDDYPDAPWDQLCGLRQIPADDRGLRVNHEFVWDTLTERLPRDVAYIRAVVSALESADDVTTT